MTRQLMDNDGYHQRLLNIAQLSLSWQIRHEKLRL